MRSASIEFNVFILLSWTIVHELNRLSFMHTSGVLTADFCRWKQFLRKRSVRNYRMEKVTKRPSVRWKCLFRTLFRASTILNKAILSPWHQEWCHAISLYKLSEKVTFVDFPQGNKVFDFWIGILSQISEIMNHLKTLTTVSMKQKLCQEIHFGTSFHKNFYLNGFWEG